MESGGNRAMDEPQRRPVEPGEDISGLVFDIRRFSVHDGPGIRTTVFFKGCPLQCAWCHNPESRNPWCETYDRELPLGGRTLVERIAVGVRMPAGEVMREILRDLIFMDRSGGGVTFSGGEPLLQPEFLHALLDRCRARELHTALDTCGHVPAEIFDSVLPKVDLFLYDMKLVDEAAHERHTGASNALIMENLRTLVRRGKRVVLRMPVIPGVNDTEENLTATARMLRFLVTIERLDLLPYHAMALHKYRRLGMPEPPSAFQPPGADRMREIASYFKQQGLNVTIGGTS
jgi:pyruvate formate lyase activating enzyme